MKLPGVQETAIISHESVLHTLGQAGLSEESLKSLNLLEIGSGGGAVMPYYSKSFNSVHCIDTSPSMLLHLSSHLPPNVTHSLHFITPDSPTQLKNGETFYSPVVNDNERKLSPPRSEFDVIVANLVVHHIDDLDGFMGGVVGLLKSGGWVVFTEFGKESESGEKHVGVNPKEWHDQIAQGKKDQSGSVNAPGHFHPAFTRRTLSELLERHGLVDIQTEIRGRLPVWEDKDSWPLCLIARGRKA